MLVPLYGFLQGDTVGLLVLARDSDTIGEVARKLQLAAAVRVAPPDGELEVLHDGKRLEPGLTVAQCGLAPLERVVVRPLVEGQRS